MVELELSSDDGDAREKEEKRCAADQMKRREGEDCLEEKSEAYDGGDGGEMIHQKEKKIMLMVISNLLVREKNTQGKENATQRKGKKKVSCKGKKMK